MNTLISQREFHGDEAFEIEAAGAKAGINPMFGGWSQRFDFAPVPHRGTGGAIRRSFQDAIRAELTNKFAFWGEVRVTITLYLDVQTVLESSDTADVDNYAKAILDAIKGPNGIIIDDTQVQALTVSWIDSHVIYFEVEIRSSPDYFFIKPIVFFEMPDGLFYPQPSTSWSPDGPKVYTDFDHFAGLTILEMSAAGKRHIRHVLRQGGQTRLQASRNSAYFETQLRGFHRSRLADSGFDMIPMAEWRAKRMAWAEGDPEKSNFLTEMAAEYRDSIEKLAEAMAAVEEPRAGG
ncbi:MAG: RusA family crossover junction endodeoxyribonuclease [Phenylobacterium sp.]|uniref:RusA family crossover junction endodeoxyribonuclease n=1 Tax=Phenylobacterium sp. TaxID=1871053 RepID=UPI00183E7A0A|nr:RusA family crossover junction endodeoxyribonuclease [Phenylobacterium sp.]MBA4792452.1 RusA family crossover junction endodeoxyribonuclease [Phenylobacterium sp.]